MYGLIAKYASFMKEISISRRLILYVTLLLAVQIVLIGYFSYNWVSIYIKELYIKKISENNYSIMRQANYVRSRYEDLSDRLLSNTSMQELLLENYKASSAQQVFQTKSTIDGLLSDPNDTVNTVFAAQNGIIYQSYRGNYNSISYDLLKNTKVYNFSKASDGSNIWIAANENIFTGAREPFLYICRTYKSLEFKPRILGQLIIQIPVMALANVFQQSNMEDGEYYAVIENNGNYIYHTANPDLIGERTDKSLLPLPEDGVNGYRIVKDTKENLIISYSVFERKGWSIIHVLPMSVISSAAWTESSIILLIMLLSLIVSIPLLMLVSKSITHPIKKLKAVVERFGSGNLDIRVITKRMDEIGHLQTSFNTMAEEINNLLVKINEENRQRRLMELNILEYQINPHFLYNSLDDINLMAYKAGNKDIEELVNALARFFRVGLSKGREFYRIKDELEHVRQYLLINKIRFKDCFQFELSCEPDIQEYSTIKIILQPIAENAIKYGIDKRNTNGLIRISVKKAEDAVLFEVSDNGTGMPKEKVQAIQAILSKHIQVDMDSGNGFGLYNVNQRIWMQFGDGYGITLQSSIGRGTTVYIKIPTIGE